MEERLKINIAVEWIVKKYEYVNCTLSVFISLKMMWLENRSVQKAKDDLFYYVFLYSGRALYKILCIVPFFYSIYR